MLQWLYHGIQGQRAQLKPKRLNEQHDLVGMMWSGAMRPTAKA
jgi:hypothetical protein